MPNPKITIEVTELGAEQVEKILRKVTVTARGTEAASRRFAGQTKKTTKDVGKMSEVLRDLETSAVLALGPLSGLGARIRAIGVLFNRSTALMAGFFAGVTALVVGVAALVTGSIQAARELEKFESRLTAITGSAILTQREIRKLSEIARRVGVDTRSTIDNFSRLAASTRGTGIEGARLRAVYENLIQGTTGLRLDTQATERIFTALSQAFSKGVLRSEELNQQLGDALPGAQKLAADALGVTTSKLNEMLAAGEILTREFIEPFAEEVAKAFGDAESATTSLTAAFNRLSSVTFEFFVVLDELTGVSTIFLRVMNFLSDVIEGIAEILTPAVSQFNRFTREVEAFIKVSERLGGAPSFDDIEEFKAEANDLIKTLDDLIRQEELRISTMRQFGVAEGDIGGNIGELVEARGRLVDVMVKLNELTVREPDEIDAVSKAMERLTRIFDDAQGKMESTRKSLSLLLQGDVAGSDFVGELESARKALRRFDEATIEALSKTSRFKGLDREGLAQALANIKTNADRAKDAIRLFADNRTALEEFNDEIVRLNRLKETFPELGETVERAMDKSKRALLETTEGFQLIKRSANEFNTALVNTLTGAENTLDAFRNFAKRVVDDILETFLRLKVINPLINEIFDLKPPSEGGGGLITSFLGSILSALAGGTPTFGSGGTGSLSGSVIGPGIGTVGLQGGGIARANQPHFVGEAGRELFVPRTTGTVVPNGESVGGRFTQIINISPGVREAVRQEVNALRPTLQADAIVALNAVRRLGPKI